MLLLKEVIKKKEIMLNPLIVIPARMGSLRLPQKPLALINREPMIVHVWRNACAANIGRVVVACDHEDIVKAIETVGGEAVMTKSSHPTGSDRIYEAAQIIDPEEKHSVIINVQGDLPVFPNEVLSSLLPPFISWPDTDMTTFIQEFRSDEHPAHSVKVRVSPIKGSADSFRCLDFSRKGINAAYVHVGIYAFRRKALAAFASLAQTEHECSESLEQLRALDHDFSIIGVLLGNQEFLSVDIPQDLKVVCARMACK